MTNRTTKEYLDYFVKSQNPNFAIMLKGKWGAGKTYFIRGIIEEWDNAAIISQSEINLKPIYISLNGIAKKSEVVELLKAKISPFLYSKGAKFASDVFKGFIKSTLKIDFDYDNDNKADGSVNINFDPISIFKSSNDKIKGNRILIFDDVERCKIPLDELYGFINDFVEHSQCKVILISDEDKINDKHNNDSKYEYSVFKEKIIGQTFEIKPDTDQAIDFFLNSVSKDIKPHLLESRNLIINIFNISKKENLRVLQRGIYDFERLFNFIDKDLTKGEEKYKILFRNYLSYFLIYFLEIKTGNEDISLFQQQTYVSDDKSEKNYNQYDEVVSTFNLHHSTKLFSPFKLVNYIKNGDFEELVNEINNSIIFAKGIEEKDWEKLWYWKLLDDDDFLILLDNVHRSFFTTEDFHITEILHISGILFSLIDVKLYNSKNKSQVVKRAKQLIKESNLSDFKDTMGFSVLTWGSWRKGYASDKTEEFKTLVKYTRELLEEIKNEKSEQTIESLFCNLTSENVDELYQKIRQYDDNLGNIIERTPMLSKLNSKKFAETIFNLNNDALFKLKNFFEYRYFPERTYSNVIIEDQQRQEKTTLISLNLKISKEINAKKNGKMVIRKQSLKELKTIIEQSIDRL
ncbi:KAP family NTPase [Flavobacterium collinsii]|uniref:KAP family P-loop domain-containing protein n=1 Tax=Flavobacterium collinsii TaxID=1114861 RepID=A0A9W4TKK4_9FLAO|nr:KAP family NTPase [Flavobacterium collinsii]CAI2768610.1 KAP family P-loop domain-containing protein [Flavobacterium collinsii]